MTDRKGRGIRAWYKRAWRWVLGPWTDPHTHLGSAARFVGLGAFLVLAAYVLGCLWLTFKGIPMKPDPWVMGSLSSLICAALALRAKSTQEPKIRMPSPDRVPDAPAPQLPAKLFASPDDAAVVSMRRGDADFESSP